MEWWQKSVVVPVKRAWIVVTTRLRRKRDARKRPKSKRKRERHQYMRRQPPPLPSRWSREWSNGRQKHQITEPDINGRGVLVKLHDDIQTCAYEDVQVMWEMLQRSETDRLTREPSPKGARALVWLHRQHKMDPRRRG